MLFEVSFIIAVIANRAASRGSAGNVNDRPKVLRPSRRLPVKKGLIFSSIKSCIDFAFKSLLSNLSLYNWYSGGNKS